MCACVFVHHRPSNSHGFTVRLTVSGLISQSHGLASKSHCFVAPGSLTVRAITHTQ